jgi:REP element-mobilizing transposase RayT
MARGRKGQNIFLNDLNRLEFLELFGELCLGKNWVCYAYCLMNNHYHWVLETSDANVPSGIRQLNSTYARGFNRGQGRQGQLFQGCLLINFVENPSYLRGLIRYVVLNPVRAKIVQDPEAWLWSSYPATIGARPVPSWLARARLLSHFGPTLDQGIASLIDFVRERQGARSIRSELRARSVLLRRNSREKNKKISKRLGTSFR